MSELSDDPLYRFWQKLTRAVLECPNGTMNFNSSSEERSAYLEHQRDVADRSMRRDMAREAREGSQRRNRV